jgi:outer membrane lipoprotein SlyB
MRKPLILGSILVAGLSLGACTTYDRYGYDGYGYSSDRYGYAYDRYGNRYYDSDGDGVAERAVTGAAVGAAGGAAVGAIVPGISPVEGAVAGAVAGGIIGAATADDRRTSGREMRWYRDSRGYCYYVNDLGQRIYDYNVRC